MADLFHELPPNIQKVLLNGPAIPPPPGLVPNFFHPPNDHSVGWAVTGLCITLSAMAVALRMYSRIVSAKRFVIEDLFVLAALGVYAGLQYFVILLTAYPGYFVHTWDIQLKDLSAINFNIVAASTVHGILIMLLKTAILLDLLRLFCPCRQRNWFFWACYTILWTNVVFYITCTFLEIFGCQPRARLWDKLIPGRCLNMDAVIVASGAVNLLSDLTILLLPQNTIWRLNLSSRKKLGVSAIFAVALLACLSAALRLAYSIPHLYDRDYIYSWAYTTIWIQAELTAGFLVLGFPTLPSIVKSSARLQRILRCVGFWRGAEGSKVKTNSRRGLPSWYKFESRRKVSPVTGWSDVENTRNDSVVMDEIGAGSGGQSRAREVRMGMEINISNR